MDEKEKKKHEKDMKKYLKHLKDSAANFGLTAMDLSNLYDLLYMLDTPWEIQKKLKMDLHSTLKANNMLTWYRKFFAKLDDIILYDPEKDEKNKIARNVNHKNKNDVSFDELLKEDLEYFEKQVEKGVKRLAGPKTPERVRNCYHCKLWNRAEKFIKEVKNL